MGMIDKLKKMLGIGQEYNPKDYIDDKWLNPPEVVHHPYEVGVETNSDVLGVLGESKPKEVEETHLWRQRAERELPDADYYIENFTEEQLRELVIANRTGHDISVFADPRQTPEQLRYIYKSAEAGEDVTYYIHNLNFDPVLLNSMKGELFEQEVKEFVKIEKLAAVDDLIEAANKNRQSQPSVEPKDKSQEIDPER